MLLKLDYFYYYVVRMICEFSPAELALCEKFPEHCLGISIGQGLFPTSTPLDGQRA